MPVPGQPVGIGEAGISRRSDGLAHPGGYDCCPCSSLQPQFGKQVRKPLAEGGDKQNRALEEQQTVAVALILRVEAAHSSLWPVVAAQIEQPWGLRPQRAFEGGPFSEWRKIVKRNVQSLPPPSNGADPTTRDSAVSLQHKQKALLAARQLAGESVNAAADPGGRAPGIMR